MAQKKNAPSKSKPTSRKPAKNANRKKPQNKKKTSSGNRTSPLSTIVGLLVITLMIGLGMMFFPRWFPPTPPEQTLAPKKPTLPPPMVKPKPELPTYEVFTDNMELNPPEKPVMPPQTDNDNRPRVSIIIDDMGYQKTIGKKLLALDIPLSFAILPFSPNKTSFAQSAHAKGRDILLHLPMEPMEYPRVDPGPGALLHAMDPDELIAQLETDLEAVPYIIGVNNHMGSRLTTVSTQMYQIFTILKKRDLFFIDSRTHPKTVCRPSARLLKIRFAERDVFLDHVQSDAAVARQIGKLVQVAEKNGHAIGIGHPHQVTLNALKQALPMLKSRVRIIPISELAHPVS